MKSYVVAISGASGAVFGIRLVEELLKSADHIYLCLSGTAFYIIQTETGIQWSGDSEEEIERNIQKHFSSEKVLYFSETNLAAPVSSGSFLTDGMFVVPCSMKTLSGIAHGYASNLIERAADVVLKEGRKLILSPRETPFNQIHLENMLRLKKMGAAIVPPIPAFYQGPQELNDIIDFVVGKILDSAGITHTLFKRWK